VKSSWQHIILEICNVVIARCEKLHFCEKKAPYFYHAYNVLETVYMQA